MQCEKQKSTKGNHLESSSIRIRGGSFSQFGSGPLLCSRYRSIRQGRFPEQFSAHATTKLDFQTDASVQETALFVYHLVKLEHLLTSYACLCSEQTVLPHIRGDNRRKERGRRRRRRRRHLEGRKKKFTSVTFLYLDVSILNCMAKCEERVLF